MYSLRNESLAEKRNPQRVCNSLTLDLRGEGSARMSQQASSSGWVMSRRTRRESEDTETTKAELTSEPGSGRGAGDTHWALGAGCAGKRAEGRGAKAKGARRAPLRRARPRRVSPGHPGSSGRLSKAGRGRAAGPGRTPQAEAEPRAPGPRSGTAAGFQYLPRRALLPARASGTCTRTCPRGPAPPRPAPPPQAPAPPPRATGPAPAAPAPRRPQPCPPASGARPRAAPSPPARAASPRPAAPAPARPPRAAPPPRTGTAWRRAARRRSPSPRGRRTWPEREAAAAIGRRRGGPGRQGPGRRRGHVRGCTFFGLHHAAQEPWPAPAWPVAAGEVGSAGEGRLPWPAAWSCSAAPRGGWGRGGGKAGEANPG